MLLFGLSFVLLSSLSVFCNAQIGEYEPHLAHNFTLAAVNTTLPNANATGVPLVLGQNGASSGVEFFVTSTYSSYPYNDYPRLGLVNNTLRAYGKDGRWITNATEVRSGDPLGWITTIIWTSPAPEIYSALRIPSHQYPLLAVNGFANLWSLCPFSGNYPQTNVVFNISADIPPPPYLGFDPARCYPVLINMISMFS